MVTLAEVRADDVAAVGVGVAAVDARCALILIWKHTHTQTHHIRNQIFFTCRDVGATLLTLAVCAVAPVTCRTNTFVAAEGVLTHAVAAAHGRILHTFIHIWERDEDTGQLLMHSFMTVFLP